MNVSTRSRLYPKNRHYGFKRPVFIEPVKEDSESENDEKEDTKDSEPETPPQPQRINLKPLSFNISAELLSVPNDISPTPSFDWIDDSDKFENLFNNPTTLLHDDSDFIENIIDFDINIDPIF